MLNKINILVSYAYARKGSWFETFLAPCGSYVNILLDSGAFTVFQSANFSNNPKKLNPILLSDYITFIKKYKNTFWQYIQLDKVGDRTTTLSNFEIMQEAGLNPMGVLTMDMPYIEVKRLTKKNKHYCVAGGVKTRLNYAISRYQNAHKVNPKGKIHGLGFVRVPEMFQCPVFSVDCSSSTSGERYGTIQMYKKNEGVKSALARELVRNKSNKFDAIREDLLSCGIKLETIVNNFSVNYGVTVLAGCNAYLNFMMECKARGKEFFIVITGIRGFVSILGIIAHKKGLHYDFIEAQKTCRKLSELYLNKNYT